MSEDEEENVAEDVAAEAAGLHKLVVRDEAIDLSHDRRSKAPILPCLETVHKSEEVTELKKENEISIMMVDTNVRTSSEITGTKMKPEFKLTVIPIIQSIPAKAKIQKPELFVKTSEEHSLAEVETVSSDTAASKLSDWNTSSAQSALVTQPISVAQPIPTKAESEEIEMVDKTPEEKRLAEIFADVVPPDAAPRTSEWREDLEAGGLLSSESRISRYYEVARSFFCCGMPIQAPSEDNISYHKHYAI